MTNVKGNFSINAEVNKVNKPNLISPRNPCYTDPIQQYFGQKGIQMNDSDEKTELPIQVIISAFLLCSSQYQTKYHDWK